jgi:hypothetical protein
MLRFRNHLKNIHNKTLEKNVTLILGQRATSLGEGSELLLSFKNALKKHKK